MPTMMGRSNSKASAATPSTGPTKRRRAPVVHDSESDSAVETDIKTPSKPAKFMRGADDIKKTGGAVRAMALSNMDDAEWSTLSYRVEVQIDGALRRAHRRAHRQAPRQAPRRAHLSSRRPAMETVANLMTSATYHYGTHFLDPSSRNSHELYAVGSRDTGVWISSLEDGLEIEAKGMTRRSCISCRRGVPRPLHKLEDCEFDGVYAVFHRPPNQMH